MEADGFGELGDGSGLSNRQRRRRDRDRYPVTNGNSQSLDGQFHARGDFGGLQGRRGADIGARSDFRPPADFGGDFVNGVYRPNNGTHRPDSSNGVYRLEGRYPADGGYGRNGSSGAYYEHYDAQDFGQRGRGDGRWNRGRGYGGRQRYHQHAPPPPPAWPDEEEHGLKDLLLQVAPQARIVENTSRLSSKASANILSRVLNEAANTSTADDFEQGTDGVSSSADIGNINSGHNAEDDDDESAFMERWSTLFSKSSPLVEGNMEDPFQDVKQRTKVVWKKGSDRKGHRTRQKMRKQMRDQALGGENGEEEQDDEEAGASVVYDASRTQWQPQRPPAHEQVMFQ